MAPAPTRYVLLSLPLSTFDTGDKEEALDSLRSTITPENGSVLPFPVPNFKIGTLDALVQQADDLVKLDSACEALVGKVGDSLRTLYEGDEEKTAQQKTVNDKPIDQYLRSFTWNKVRYRADKPVGELIDTLQKELVTIDNDVKGKFNQYNQVKTNFTTLQRKQTGNLATKSLTPIVNPSLLVQDSEYLETHLIAVPSNLRKDFLKSYETLAPMVVPRSSLQVAQDDEFVLFAVTTFKKHGAEFQQKCREQKWTPRQYKYVEGGREEEQKELDRVQREEKKVWGEALRLSRTGWSESVMIWAHVMALRVFVESVLRYGLPLEFVSALVLSSPKLVKKIKTALDSSYSYLGGNAFGRDKRGRITKDDAALTSEMAAAGLGGHGGEGSEYTAYVYYEFQV
ncbi:V-ATPase subunit C [Biscogniauxia marginata]|nr:V-ATPase subunit C [Biscogniauxia marginata]